MKEEQDDKRSITLQDLDEIGDGEVFDLRDVHLIDIFDSNEGISKYGKKYVKRDIVVGIFEDISAKQVSEQIGVTTFNLMIVDKFGNIPRNKLLTLANIKKNTYRGNISLLTTDDTEIQIIERDRGPQIPVEKKKPTKMSKKSPKPESKAQAIQEREPDKKIEREVRQDIAVQTFGNPRTEALRIIQKGLEQVLSGIDVLIGIEKEKKERKKEILGVNFKKSVIL